MRSQSLWPPCTWQVSEWCPAVPGRGTTVGCGEGRWGAMLNLTTATQEWPLNKKR